MCFRYFRGNCIEVLYEIVEFDSKELIKYVDFEFVGDLDKKRRQVTNLPCGISLNHEI